MTKPRSGRLSIIPAAAVFDRRLGHADVRVLAALGTYADKDGRCWPAIPTLAKRTGMSERHIHRCLRALAKHGYVEIEQRAGQSSVYRIPMTQVSGVEGGTPDVGVRDPCHGSQGTPDVGVTQNVPKNDTKNDYTFAGKIIRLTQANFDTWAKAYHHIDLGAQLQALDDYYDRNLTGGDRKKWYERCSQALAKKNERARADQAQQREEPKFNDGVY
ncbi:MAG: helix-turn-helix domain-containing protein [Armatimonadetes bacterium]|nr:helix-turn-helix domain-containing protein [Armatimonadota bacterium]